MKIFDLKHIAACVSLSLCGALCVSATPVTSGHCPAAEASACQAKKGSDKDHKKWVNQMNKTKHEFFVKDLDLAKSQQKAFFDLYDAMDAELRAAGEEARQLERAVEQKGSAASADDYQRAAAAFVDFRVKEAAIQKRYHAKFAEILTPRQLYRLRYSEREFRHKMMKRHHDLKDKKK